MRISDWSSDVCSSDLPLTALDAKASRWIIELIDRHLDNGGIAVLTTHQDIKLAHTTQTDRKSVVKGKSVSVRVDLGGRRIITKKKLTRNNITTKYNKETTTHQQKTNTTIQPLQ